MSLDFLFIGAPRSGSTWLYTNLLRHPEIKIPPCKNILYFHPRFHIYRLKFFKYFGKEMWLNSDPQIRKWYRKFFFKPIVTDKWYLDLISSDKTSGEIAEAYCSLKEKDVQRIHNMNPNLKIIFIMRNPFERALSHAKLGVIKRKNKTIENVSEKKLLWHINHPSSEARSAYMRTLEIWEHYFPKDQFCIRFYEDLQNDAETFMQGICQFLEISDNLSYFEQTLKTNINTSGIRDSNLPSSVVKHTAKKYQIEVERLYKRFGGPTKQWKTEIEEILKT